MLRGDMAYLPVPTPFVWGDKDASDAGHMPQLDQPTAVAAAITGHLSGAASGDAGA